MYDRLAGVGALENQYGCMTDQRGRGGGSGKQVRSYDRSTGSGGGRGGGIGKSVWVYDRPAVGGGGGSGKQVRLQNRTYEQHYEKT